VKSGIKVLIAISAIAVTVGILAYGNRTVVPKAATWEDVVGEAKRGGYRLIKTEELWEQYQKDPGGVLLVDTRQQWEYRTGHIKAALFFPIEPTWFSRWRNKGALKRFLGPDKNRSIIFY
jgi:hypothetical protein